MKLSGGNLPTPDICRNDDTDHCKPLLCQLRGFRMRRRPLCPVRLLDIGSLSSYLVYVRQSAMPMNQFTQQVNFLLAALSGAERIFQMMEEEPEIERE